MIYGIRHHRKATRIFYDRTDYPDGAILEMTFWAVPRPVEGSDHHLKYSLFHGRPGQRLVAYDNERGETVSETNVTFCDLEALLAALTPKRLHLLRYVRHHQVRNVSALATSLGRNYKNVHKDVEELTKLGLLSRTPDQVVAPYAEVDAHLVL